MDIARLILYCSLMFDLSASVKDCINAQCLQTWTVEYAHSLGGSRCGCGALLGQAGSCTMYQDAGELNIKIKIGYCMTYDEDSNITYTGRCPYNNLPFHLENNIATVDLPQDASLLNNFMCNNYEHLCYTRLFSLWTTETPRNAMWKM